MTKTLFITSYSPKGWEEYARDCIHTWGDLPGSLVLMQEQAEHEAVHVAATAYNLLADVEMRRFLEGCRIFPILRGITQDGGYSYHFDAAKFARKVFAITNAVKNCPEFDRYVWLDADIRCHLPADRAPFEKILDEITDGVYVTYMGRPWFDHSECSFMAFNKVDFPEVHKNFMQTMRESYTKGLFLGLPGYHDCYVFDVCRTLIEPPERNLVPQMPGTLNVMPHTILAPYMTHLKGAAKRGGVSA